MFLNHSCTPEPLDCVLTAGESLLIVPLLSRDRHGNTICSAAVRVTVPDCRNDNCRSRNKAKTDLATSDVVSTVIGSYPTPSDLDDHRQIGWKCIELTSYQAEAGTEALRMRAPMEPDPEFLPLLEHKQRTPHKWSDPFCIPSSNPFTGWNLCIDLWLLGSVSAVLGVVGRAAATTGVGHMVSGNTQPVWLKVRAFGFCGFSL